MRDLEDLARRSSLNSRTCPSCLGPAPYDGPPVVETIETGGRRRILGQYCVLCMQAVDARGLGTGVPIGGTWKRHWPVLHVQLEDALPEPSP